jgi:hypothetical protein
MKSLEMLFKPISYEYIWKCWSAVLAIKNMTRIQRILQSIFVVGPSPGCKIKNQGQH